MRRAVIAVMLLAGSARAAPWTEWVGDYKGALTWRGCTTRGAGSVTLALDAADGVLAIDLTPAQGGLRTMTLVEDERGTLSAQDGDVTLAIAHRRGGLALSIDLASGCTVRGQLARVAVAIAPCDRLVTLARIARRCTKTEVTVPPLAAAWKARDAVACRAKAEPLETALVDAGCLPDPAPAIVGFQCRQVADEAAKLLLCPSLPPQLVSFVEQMRTVVRGSATSGQRAAAELACGRTHELLADVARQARCPL